MIVAQPPSTDEVALAAATPTKAIAGGRLGLLTRLGGGRWRERDRLLAEVLEIRGLMPLLLKHRSGSPWTRDERAELRQQLRALSHLGPYLVLLALPGSVLLLPLFAWWMERQSRRHQRSGVPRNVDDHAA
jgi:hypothetical protein